MNGFSTTMTPKETFPPRNQEKKVRLRDIR